jgi:hypothetical protein
MTPSLQARGEPIRRLSVVETSAYLARVHGVHLKPNALRLHRFKGTGPESCTILRKVYFEPEAIDAWVARLVAKSKDSRRRAKRARL